MRALGEHERDEQPLRDMTPPSGKVVDARDEQERRELNEEEDPLRWALAAVRGEDIVQERVDVQVQCGVAVVQQVDSPFRYLHERTGLALNLRIVPLARDEHVYLLHVRVPVDLGV